ncbi:ABC transporter permease [Clostridium thermobutyricum]|uniref:ABC transporter permease n=1 Tax=Clostridium thermobutyricum TaxID=29372 RepID=UPI002942C68F|nr:ABC transporter permease [Clostridium thermobutyricum]
MENLKISEDMFTPISKEEKQFEKNVRPSVGYWKDAWRRLKTNKVALGSLIVIILLVIMVIVTPMVSQYAYDAQDMAATSQRPGGSHIFGTDTLGRDLFVRVMMGAKYSLIVGVGAAIINLFIGVIYGAIAGFFGGKVDTIMMRIVDCLYSIPTMIYAVLIMAVLKGSEFDKTGIISIMIALSISYWVGMARIVRGDILQLKQQEFVLAAKALGASKGRILFKHLIPNCIGSIIVTMTLLIPQAIFTEAFLSYIGLGINAPRASLGTLCSEAQSVITIYPYQLFFPALIICIIILAFNLLGDGLTEALDPKHQR